MGASVAIDSPRTATRNGASTHPANSSGLRSHFLFAQDSRTVGCHPAAPCIEHGLGPGPEFPCGGRIGHDTSAAVQCALNKWLSLDCADVYLN